MVERDSTQPIQHFGALGGSPPGSKSHLRGPQGVGLP